MRYKMKRKAAQVALGLLSTKKSPVSNFTRKSTTNQIIKKKQKTAAKTKVQNTVDKRKHLNRENVKSSVKKKAIENRKTSKRSVRGRSREPSSSTATESSSEEEEEEENTDEEEQEEEDEKEEEEEEEEEQPRKKFKTDKGQSVSMQKNFSRAQLKNRRHLMPSAVLMLPKLSSRLEQQRHHETSESEEETVRNLRQDRGLRRRSCSGSVENEVLKRELVVKVRRSENQSLPSHCNDGRASKVLKSKKPNKDMMERLLRRERRLEVRKRTLMGGSVSLVSCQDQSLDDDDDEDKNQETEEESCEEEKDEKEKEEKEKDEKENEKENAKEKRAEEGEVSSTVLRDLSVALTDVCDSKNSKAEKQKQLEKEANEDKDRGTRSVGKPDPRKRTYKKNHSTKVNNRAAKVADFDNTEVIISSDDDTDEYDMSISSPGRNPSSAVWSQKNGVRRWSSWNRSRLLPRSSAPVHDSGIQLLDDHTKVSAELLRKMPAIDILGIINKLQDSFTKMTSVYENRLREKDEIIGRLKDEPSLQVLRLRNELEFKTQQVEDLNEIAERNVEIEAKINLLLSDRKAYDAELQRLADLETIQLGDKDFVVVENQVTSSEGEQDGEEVKKKKGKKRKRKKSGEDEDEDEANEIEELLIGLQETPGDVSFTLPSVPPPPQPIATPVQGVVPEPQPLPQQVRPLPSQETRTLPPQEVREVVGDESLAWRKGRHEIRGLVKKLSEETKVAAKLEVERRERVKKERLKHLVVMDTDDATGQKVCRQLVLAFNDDDRTIPLVEVNAQLLSQLKLHQVEAVEFMWDSVVESMERVKDGGTGCILAHCMGLGKTLSVISLLDALLSSDIGFRRCLIVSPLNAVLNWVNEWEKWVKPEVRPPVFDLAAPGTKQIRADVLSQWCRDGGILIVSYSLFRLLVSYRGRSQRLKAIFNESLIDPGPDLVVCDEGHVLKNYSSAISKCLNRVSTKRRIILTGTPLQNNLIEYHCMVNFVRNHLLGTRVEFLNRFVNPITNGQHLDSTSDDVQLMKRRAHVLHQMLTGCIHRCDYSTLVKFLPPKHEFVITVRLSQRQIDLYKKYLDLCRGSEVKKNMGATLFSDYQNLMRIWTHPWQLRMDQIRQQNKPLSFSDDDELESDVYTSSSSEEEEEKEEEEEVEEEEVVEEEEEQIEEEKKEQDNEKDQQENHTEQGTEVAEGGGEKGVDLRGKEGKDELEKKAAKGGRKAGQLENIRQMERDGDERTSEDEEDALAALGYKAVLSSLLNGYGEESEHSGSGGEGDGEDSEDIETVAIDSVDEESTEVVEVVEKTETGTECGTRVIAGEVIRNWQTRKRRNGPGVEIEEEEVVAVEEEMWWSSLLSKDDHLKVELSGKIALLFEILRLAEDIGDKVLVFSQSLLSLNLIEDFLKMKTDEATQQSCTTQSGCADDAAGGGDDAAAPAAVSRGVWIKDEDYLRMDGSTVAAARKRLTANFNDTSNTRLRLFLISTKAGGLSINLASANRVIIFDASWNPSHDIQSIFRVYRFGQLKPVFIYRFLAQGTMEEKIYDRQVTKETLSHRVIDEQQINRHFTAADLSQLYAFNPDQMDNDDRPTLPIPKDVILRELLSRESEESRRWIVEYHHHDSLLERRPEEDLTEDERKAAWEEYEHERHAATTINHFYPHIRLPEQPSKGTTIDNFNPHIRVPEQPSKGTTIDHFNPHMRLPEQPSKGAAVSQVIDLCPSTSKTSSISSIIGNQLQQPPIHSLSSSAPKQMTKAQITSLSDELVDLVTGSLPPHLKSRLNFQMSRLPRVIQEIIRYNPEITIEDLLQRINSFIGINTT